MVSGAKCVLSASGKAVGLEPIQAHIGDVHQGGKSLTFVFREAGPESALPGQPDLLVDVDVSIRLADGSKCDGPKQKAVPTRNQIIQVDPIHIRIPRRTVWQVLRRRFNRVKAAIQIAWEKERRRL